MTKGKKADSIPTPEEAFVPAEYQYTVETVSLNGTEQVKATSVHHPEICGYGPTEADAYKALVKNLPPLANQ